MILFLGPKPNPPHNLTISVVQGGYILKWIAPKEDAAAVAYYTVDYQVDTTWKRLSKTEIMPSETSFFGMFNSINNSCLFTNFLFYLKTPSAYFLTYFMLGLSKKLLLLHIALNFYSFAKSPKNKLLQNTEV